MALGACRECGLRVSSEAVTCPHCGARTPVGAAPSAAAPPTPPTMPVPVRAPTPTGPHPAAWAALITFLVVLAVLFAPTIMRHLGRSPLTGGRTEGIVRVTAPEGSCWSGSIGAATQDGCGERTFPVHDSLGLFSSNAQKRDAGDWTLTVTVEIDGSPVATNSTSAAYGVAQVVVGQ
jgi:hypothetical protein